MFEIEIRDIKWNKISFGKPENPCLIFIHGFMGSSEDWIPIMKQFANEYYCIAFDLPGHNKTTVEAHDEFYSIENTIVCLKNEIEKLKISRFVLIGYSMGGRISLSFAIRFRELISKLVLVSSSPGIESALRREERINNDKIIANKILNMEMRNFLKLWYSAPIFGEISKSSMFGKLLSKREFNNKESLVQSLKYAGTGVMKPLWNDIQMFYKPVLLLVGELDKTYLAINTKMNEIFPKSQLEIVKDSAHIVYLEQAKEFEIRLRNFIEKQN